jgi:hypothetical protein
MKFVVKKGCACMYVVDEELTAQFTVTLKNNYDPYPVSKA